MANGNKILLEFILEQKALAVYLQKYENAANLCDIERQITISKYKVDLRKIINKIRTPLSFDIIERYGTYLAKKRKNKIDDILR